MDFRPGLALDILFAVFCGQRMRDILKCLSKLSLRFVTHLRGDICDAGFGFPQELHGPPHAILFHIGGDWQTIHGFEDFFEGGSVDQILLC